MAVVGTAKKFYSAITGNVYAVDGLTSPTSLNNTQSAALDEAALLWNDIANVQWMKAIDDAGLARKTNNLITVEEKFLGITYNTYQYYENVLPNDWTRVGLAQITDANILGINKSRGANGFYHEVYIDFGTEGVANFARGSRAFGTLIHELGHSMGIDHIQGDRTQAIMAASETNNAGVWYASTPMSGDIDAAIARFGLNTNTRAGNDTYGFNASLSGGARAAFDFTINTRPLVTIYDTGGRDTLDAFGFDSMMRKPVSLAIDLTPGATSTANGTPFAVIYRTSVVEGAVGGPQADTIRGNNADNTLNGGGGNDTLWGGAGNDAIDGGAGYDIVTFAGRIKDYVVGRPSGSSFAIADSVANRDGADRLSSVEILSFTDGNLFVADAQHASIARLYAAAFDRQPDVGGLINWQSFYDASVPESTKGEGAMTALARFPAIQGTQSIAGGFTGSAEFQGRYGTLNDTQFVTQLYKNVLGRGPEAAGLTNWLQAMQYGDGNGTLFTRDMVLVGFATSQENVIKTASWLIEV